MNGYKTTHHMTQVVGSFFKMEYTTCRNPKWKVKSSNWDEVNCPKCLKLRPGKPAKRTQRVGKE